jgi:hypothetical protein
MQWRSDPLSFKVLVPEIPKRLIISHFDDSRCSGGVTPVFQIPSSRNAETTNHFTFQRFHMQWRSDPLSFKVPIAKVPKRLIRNQWKDLI